jgi:hypothetical protein
MRLVMIINGEVSTFWKLAVTVHYLKLLISALVCGEWSVLRSDRKVAVRYLQGRLARTNSHTG